jgi:hypothetical protein
MVFWICVVVVCIFHVGCEMVVDDVLRMCHHRRCHRLSLKVAIGGEC